MIADEVIKKARGRSKRTILIFVKNSQQGAEAEMAKEKFERTKPHVNIGTIGHIDHGKTTSDRSHHRKFWRRTILRCSSARLTRLTTRRKKRRAVSPSRSPTSSTRPRSATTRTSTARPRRLHQEHDYRRGADGRRDSRGRRDGRSHAADARAHPARSPGRCAVHRRVLEQVRHGGRPGIAGTCRAGSSRAARRATTFPATTFPSFAARR